MAAYTSAESEIEEGQTGEIQAVPPEAFLGRFRHGRL
jgi:hypothetical protein